MGCARFFIVIKFYMGCNKTDYFLDYIYERRQIYNNRLLRMRGDVMENFLQLVKKAKKGDGEAFAALYGDIYENMYRFALYTLRNTADAEDVVSEAVVDAFAHIRKLRSEEAFRGWIFRILSNKCKNKLREYANKTLPLEEQAEEYYKEEGLEEAVVIRRTFFELEDEERLIISMHLFCGYKSREIADILHMNENTVRSKESRGLKKMEKRLIS